MNTCTWVKKWKLSIAQVKMNLSKKKKILSLEKPL